MEITKETKFIVYDKVDNKECRVVSLNFDEDGLAQVSFIDMHGKLISASLKEVKVSIQTAQQDEIECKRKIVDILLALPSDDEFYQEKTYLLCDIIKNTKMERICPDNLVGWCSAIGLKTKSQREVGASWWTVSGQ